MTRMHNGQKFIAVSGHDTKVGFYFGWESKDRRRGALIAASVENKALALAAAWQEIISVESGAPIVTDAGARNG